MPGTVLRGREALLWRRRVGLQLVRPFKIWGFEFQPHQRESTRELWCWRVDGRQVEGRDPTEARDTGRETACL